jgi:hypothetical protein
MDKVAQKHTTNGVTHDPEDREPLDLDEIRKYLATIRGSLETLWLVDDYPATTENDPEKDIAARRAYNAVRGIEYELSTWEGAR